MSKKPNFITTKEQRLLKAQQELQNEEREPTANKMVQTTLIIEAPLLYAVKEIALKRKQAGIKPNTVTGIIKGALRDIIKNEK